MPISAIPAQPTQIHVTPRPVAKAATDGDGDNDGSPPAAATAAAGLGQRVDTSA